MRIPKLSSIADRFRRRIEKTEVRRKWNLLITGTWKDALEYRQMIPVKARLDGECAEVLCRGEFRAFAIDCKCLWFMIIAILNTMALWKGRGEIHRQVVSENERAVVHK